MSARVRDILEIAARWIAAAFFGLLCFIGRDALVQLRRIQTDLVGIKVKLAQMEASALTPDAVRQLIKVELYESNH